MKISLEFIKEIVPNYDQNNLIDKEVFWYDSYCSVIQRIRDDKNIFHIYNKCGFVGEITESIVEDKIVYNIEISEYLNVLFSKEFFDYLDSNFLTIHKPINLLNLQNAASWLMAAHALFILSFNVYNAHILNTKKKE